MQYLGDDSPPQVGEDNVGFMYRKHSKRLTVETDDDGTIWVKVKGKPVESFSADEARDLAHSVLNAAYAVDGRRG